MRRILLLLGFAVLFSTSLSAQVAPQPSQQAPTMPAASKDPQAVSILTQAINSMGGSAAIKAVTDYAATGNIAYHVGPGNDVQGSVTVVGGPMGQVRMDSNLPSGTRSWAVDGLVSTKAEDGTVWKTPTGAVPSSDAFPYRTPRFPNSLAFPLRQLVTVLNSSAFNLSYKGLVQLDGRSVHDIQAQPVMPTQVNPRNPIVASRALDFFIDASSFQLAMAQDLAAKGTLHQLRYSDYRSAGGVLAPFAISEQIGRQATWTIQLSKINFNTGVQDSAFAIQ